MTPARSAPALTAASSPDEGHAGAYPADPHILFGDLFTTVQTRRIFADGKTFADLEPLATPDAILAAWRVEQPADDDAIRGFLDRHFEPLVEAPPPLPETGQSLNGYIESLWNALTRAPKSPGPGSSALPLPHPFVAPGGRFREIFYWDSYFTMLGLRIDGRQALVDGMLDDLVSLVERYGHVPNGARTYFLTRSQPPFLALMLALSTPATPEVERRRLEALKREHAYWMSGAPDQPGAARHVVTLPNGAHLNRYWDAADRPRPESYFEDVETAGHTDRPAAEVYRDLRAGAESGWDYSSRWLSDPADLATIETTSLIAVDLNCLLHHTELTLAEACRAAGETDEAAAYAKAAEARAAAIQTYLWSEAEGCFLDWNWRDGRPSPHVSAATLYPLFLGLATPEQARAVAARVAADLLAPRGLRTTLLTTGQQWDVPNGWAPLQWVAVEGLRRYGEAALAREIAMRWLGTVERRFTATGFLFEKYDIESDQAASGGEYPNQLGFGWTNGVVRALQTLLPELTTEAP